MARTIVITGATSGIGRALALHVAREYDRMLLIGRSEERGREISDAVHCDDVRFASIDLASLAGMTEAVRFVGGATGSVDAFVHAAGVMPRERHVTADGHELAFAVHHLAAFALTRGLLGRMPLEASIVHVNSVGHRWPLASFRPLTLPFDDLDYARDYHPYEAYSRSKLANLLALLAWARRLPDGPVINALHPGLVRSNIAREQPRLLAAAYNAIAVPDWHAAAHAARLLRLGPAAGTGQYVNRERVDRPSPQARDVPNQERLWHLTDELLESVPVL
ncbi:SDR family NAD(P)-dependent oxidoreductase [Herbiconiux sp. SYSU D00978]|uniref:SDR family NAD(P)-dependent oxidoreductase n=1 Tax=Herbiconiux sp. SYSU D00978 TaxID=2812562 RepID=UPI001A965FA7|nr:SDR family NAD(P)-dependent oxidoreductase [Herbiconiux sp. SYSU D00978]